MWFNLKIDKWLNIIKEKTEKIYQLKLKGYCKNLLQYNINNENCRRWLEDKIHITIFKNQINLSNKTDELMDKSKHFNKYLFATYILI